MKTFIAFLTFVLTQSAFAQDLNGTWAIENGKAEYKVSFPLKNVEGQSSRVKGKGQCTETTCEFLVATPVASFDSGDGNRDAHMREVTKAALHPMVAVKISFANPKAANQVKAKLDVTFAGKNKSYQDVPITLVQKDGGIKTQGTWTIQLSDFNVERPSLLGFSISDEVAISYDLSWKK